MIVNFRRRRKPVRAMVTGKVTIPILGIEYLATTGEVVTPIATGTFRSEIKKIGSLDYAFFDIEKIEPPMSGVRTQFKRVRISLEHLINGGYGYLIKDSGLAPVK